MEITRTSRLTGKTRTRDLPVSADELAAFGRGALIQDAFPALPASDREFILTGITAEEWDELVAVGDDDEGDDEVAF